MTCCLDHWLNYSYLLIDAGLSPACLPSQHKSYDENAQLDQDSEKSAQGLGMSHRHNRDFHQDDPPVHKPNRLLH
jgi:hypothetical protein